MATQELIREIFRRIRKINMADRGHPIPTSDEFFQQNLYDLTASPEIMKECIDILKDSHFIFSFQIVNDVEGYVAADKEVVRKVREYVFTELEKTYEHEFYTRKQARLIIRELAMKLHNYNNTPMGRMLNCAIMAKQFEETLEKRALEYTEKWKESRLKEFVDAGEDNSVDSEFPDLFETFKPPTPPPRQETVRAADSAEGQEAQKMTASGRWAQAVQKYGAEFLLRIHFRKYEFDQVIKLVKTGKINDESELRYIRDTMKLMGGRVEKDFRLMRHRKVMLELRRLAQMRINQLKNRNS